jgi:Zn-finger nucleic acid-binding protein
MREREKEDVVIDICPNCRGVWLDAGELDKLTESEDRYYRSRGWRDDDDDDDDRRRYGDERRYDDARRPVDSYGRPKKKSGFLSNLMENFGGGGMDD